MQEVAYKGVLPAMGILENLGEGSRQQLAALGAFTKLERGEVLIAEGQKQDFLFLVLSGALEVQTDAGGKPVQLGVLREGDCVGEMGMLNNAAASATVMALEESVVWSLNVDQFDLFLNQNNLAAAHVLLAIAKVLSQRLREANQIIKKHNILPDALRVRGPQTPEPITYDSAKPHSGAFSIFKTGPKEYPKAKISQSIRI